MPGQSWTTAETALLKTLVQQGLTSDKITARFSEEGIHRTQKAIQRKTGARGLRSIMEDILLEPMFDLPGMTGVEEIVINREVVEGRASPLMIYADRREDVGQSA